MTGISARVISFRVFVAEARAIPSINFQTIEFARVYTAWAQFIDIREDTELPKFRIDGRGEKSALAID